MSKIFKFIKNIILGSFFIIGYNMLASSLNMTVPLNPITILYITIFGVSGLISLIIIMLFSF